MKGRRVEKVFFRADEACCGGEISRGSGWREGAAHPIADNGLFGCENLLDLVGRWQPGGCCRYCDNPKVYESL